MIALKGTLVSLSPGSTCTCVEAQCPHCQAKNVSFLKAALPSMQFCKAPANWQSKKFSPEIVHCVHFKLKCLMALGSKLQNHEVLYLGCPC